MSPTDIADCCPTKTNKIIQVKNKLKFFICISCIIFGLFFFISFRFLHPFLISLHSTLRMGWEGVSRYTAVCLSQVASQLLMSMYAVLLLYSAKGGVNGWLFACVRGILSTPVIAAMSVCVEGKWMVPMVKEIPYFVLLACLGEAFRTENSLILGFLFRLSFLTLLPPLLQGMVSINFSSLKGFSALRPTWVQSCIKASQSERLLSLFSSNSNPLLHSEIH